MQSFLQGLIIIFPQPYPLILNTKKMPRAGKHLFRISTEHYSSNILTLRFFCRSDCEFGVLVFNDTAYCPVSHIIGDYLVVWWKTAVMWNWLINPEGYWSPRPGTSLGIIPTREKKGNMAMSNALCLGKKRTFLLSVPEYIYDPKIKIVSVAVWFPVISSILVQVIWYFNLIQFFKKCEISFTAQFGVITEKLNNILFCRNS